MSQLTPHQIAVHNRIVNDYAFFSEKFLKIVDKGGVEIPFQWNAAQKHLHAVAEAQLKEIGRVRCVVLKGRQMGLSTAIAGRFYHRISRQQRKHAFILSHQSSTTEALMRMVKQFHAGCPECIKPRIDKSNDRQLTFETGSMYSVGTAGSSEVGRGQCVQYFHGSEVAFYERGEQISAGVMQTVSDHPGTEMFMESTANGQGNFFHRLCIDAYEGRGEFRLVFCPWYWEPTYRAKIVDEDLMRGQILADEEELVAKFKLDLAQLQWRRNKIISLKSSSKFIQEYPNTVEEAFQETGAPLIESVWIDLARKSTLEPQDYQPMILGVDVGQSRDKTTVAWRKGRVWLKTDVYDPKEYNTMRMINALAGHLSTGAAQYVFVDAGFGGGIFDGLCQLGFSSKVVAVQFGSSAMDKRYYNKRAEMAGLFRDWIMAGARMPDDPDFARELSAIPDFRQPTGTLLLEKKDIIRRLIGKSTDIFDSIILTFALPVSGDVTEYTEEMYEYRMRSRSPSTGRSIYQTLVQAPKIRGWF